jgi:hypothetical protein
MSRDLITPFSDCSAATARHVFESSAQYSKIIENDEMDAKKELEDSKENLED